MTPQHHDITRFQPLQQESCQALGQGGNRYRAPSYYQLDVSHRRKLNPKRDSSTVLRDALRARHYGRRTEETYCHWVKRFVYFHHMRSPVRHVLSREVGELGEVIRARKPKRLSVVMTREEVRSRVDPAEGICHGRAQNRIPQARDVPYAPQIGCLWVVRKKLYNQ